MRKRPFFSIPIATYNRASEVEFALQRILAQSFKDFEVIISDDNSQDDTEKVIKKYKDKRIRYYKNKKNLGAVQNIGKVLSYVQGDYVFMHGDDDFLLYSDVLEKTFDVINKNKYGLVRFNYLYQSFDKKNVFDYFRNKFTNEDSSIKAKKNSIEILEFIEKVDLYFITGIVFKSPYPRKIKIIDSEFIPWFTICFENIYKQGAYYISDYNIIASWSRQEKHPVYYVKNGKLPWEELYEEIKKIAGEKYYQEALNKQLAVSVSFLMSIKYNSNNKNLMQYASRVLQLNPSYRFSLKFWVIYLISLFLPKKLLGIARLLYIKRTAISGKRSNHEKIVERIKILRGFDN